MNVLKIYAALMIALILSMPLNSAVALAATLQVQRNSGEDNIGGYLDATGDTWTLQVLAEADGEQVVKENVRVNSVPFDSCTDQGSLGKLCTYSLSRPDGFSGEGARPLRLELRKQSGQVIAKQQSQIILDGSAPTVDVNAVQKMNNIVEITYTVKEQPSSCVGLQKIQIKHGSTVLETLEGEQLKEKADAYCTTPQQGLVKAIENEKENVTLTVSSTGTQRIEVIATDRMGHEGKDVIAFAFDAVAPQIKENNLTFGRSNFVATGEAIVPVSVEIVEDGPSVEAMLKVGSFNGGAAKCSVTGSENNKIVYRCEWDAVRVNLASSVSLTLEVSDGPNKVTRTITKQFAVDDDKPQLQKFETEHALSGQNFVSREKNTFIATFRELGSGMDAATVLADFSSINSRGVVAANNCTGSGSTWTCVWSDVPAERVPAGQTKLVTLTEAKDKVGNRAVLASPTINVERDDVAPVVQNVRAIVKRTTGQGDRTYFQSRDEIFISFEVIEEHGVRASIDIDELIVDAEPLEANCVVKNTTAYICSATTPPIGQFNDNVKRIPLHVFDSAGNKALIDNRNVPALEITIFGTDDDSANPNFWTIKKQNGKNVTLNPKDGLDAGVTKLIPQRVFATMKLEGQTGIELVEARAKCEGDHVDKSFMISNFRVAGQQMEPVIVVQFEPFDPVTGNVAEIVVECSVTLLSKRNKMIVQQWETETFSFPVKFFVTNFDSDISTIEKTIDDARHFAGYQVFKVIGTLNEILTWAKIVCDVLNLLVTLWNALSGITAAATAAGSAGEVSFGAGYGKQIALCQEEGAVKTGVGQIANALETICAVVTCTGQTPKGTDEKTDSSISGVVIALRKHQKNVLDSYNNWWLGGSDLGTGIFKSGAADSERVKNLKLAAGNFAPAKSLYANVWLSVAGICLPGIIYNLEKYRQIKCRYVACLENEVKAGVATIGACRELEDYQVCKYFIGEVFQILPAVNAIDNLLKIIKSMLTDPVGLVRTVVISACSQVWCQTPKAGPSTASVCQVVAYLIFLLDLVNNVISTVNQIQTQTAKNYCEVVGM